LKYVYLHGFTSSPISQKAQFFIHKIQQFGFECIAPDLNSDNFKQLLLSEQLSRLEEHFLIDDEYILIGSSLGGLAALNLAEKFSNIKKVLLLAPAFNITNLWNQLVGEDNLHYWKANKYMEIPHHAYAKNMLLHYEFIEDLEHNVIDLKFSRQFPVKIFHGNNDETIPFIGSQDYLPLNLQAELTILNSDHSLIDDLDFIWGDSVNFLELC
jgi:predicted esterase YcpF (UPF0227 family)